MAVVLPCDILLTTSFPCFAFSLILRYQHTVKYFMERVMTAISSSENGTAVRRRANLGEVFFRWIEFPLRLYLLDWPVSVKRNNVRRKSPPASVRQESSSQR